MSDTTDEPAALAHTLALRRALETVRDGRSVADLLFLEKWEMQPLPGAAAALRINQLRRANPALAAEIRAELALSRRATLDTARRARL
jgi:hypothetical protein